MVAIKPRGLWLYWDCGGGQAGAGTINSSSYRYTGLLGMWTGNGGGGTCCTNPLLTFILTSMYVFFLPRTRILKPNLRHTLAQARNWGDALQILAIRITVNLKVGLQHLQLLLGEGGAHAFRLALVITITITALYKGGRERGEGKLVSKGGTHRARERA